MGSVNVNRNVTDIFYRYKMPRLKAKVESKDNGIKTFIVNMTEVARAIGRPATYPNKYFSCELGEPTAAQGSSLIGGKRSKRCTKKQNSENGVDTNWSVNVSKEAIRARLQDSTDGAKGMIISEDYDKTEKERIEIFYDLVKKKAKPFIQWLKETEEEESSEVNDDDSEVEIVRIQPLKAANVTPVGKKIIDEDNDGDEINIDDI
uniref:Eukaryotic translation initiation factor 5 n=1 Tax=Glossina brevipalpis TaxID=37001 RepID=A0A1A9WUA0_9MUSC